MTSTESSRSEWLAATRRASPEMEQAAFGGGVPGAGELALDEINLLNPHLFAEDRWHDHAARLRREDPVHLNELGSAGRYWSVTRYDDVRGVDGDWATFSSARGITVGNPVDTADEDAMEPLTAFITMDPPRHTEQRKTVRGIAAPSSIRNFEPLVRERTIGVLESLPDGEVFDWVDAVSIELTTLMLATLFDFPVEDRRKLTRWSDVVTAVPGPGAAVESVEDRTEEFRECLRYFERLWDDRRNQPGHDLISMLVHGESTGQMPTIAHFGNLLLLIVGGNDTTRNSMSGSVYALNRFPAEYDRLTDDPGLVDKLVPEVIRWQTPLSYMRRTATRDCEIGEKSIRRNDQVVMWYASANRDEATFGADADALRLDRPNGDRHLAFGYGIHFCMGSRLAELQLRVLWEEILERFERIEVQAEPSRTFSSFVNGYTTLPVKVVRK